MTPLPDPRRARLQELLGTEATQKLTSSEETELDTLLADYPDEDAEGLELAAAAVHLALAGPLEAMPAALAERLNLAAVAVAPAPSAHVPHPVRQRRAWTAWAGWVVAASLLGVLVYANWPKSAPTMAQSRDDLARKAPVFVGEKKSISGNIVWSDQEQIGYMEVKGLPPLDSSAGTYQLWIVDADRKDSPPVDGGVFQVKADGTTIVRIKPPIQVKRAAAFAITKEKEPGGVVVSKVPPEQYELVLTKKG